jgi:hypothetical protein
MTAKRKVANPSKESLVKKYLKYVEKNKRVPSLSQLSEIGITRNAIRHHFGSNTQLYDFMKDNYPEAMNFIVDESLFTPRRFTEIKKEANKYSRFVVTTAVVEKPIHLGFYNTIKNYCEKNNALLLVLPCQDVANRSTLNDWTLAPELHGEYIVFNDLALNSKVFISEIRQSAKHINPLTGLGRLGQKNGSMIVSSPKQALEYVQVSNKRKVPRAIMSTGAITKNDYRTDRYMSGRTSYIAENDHVIGAVIVEIADNKRFFFRQIQADIKTGSFADCGIKYLPDGKVEEFLPQAIVLGDYHAGETDPVVKRVTKEIIMATKPQDLILHDLFDGKSISHHDMGKPLVKARKAMANLLSLQNEVRFMNKELDEVSEWVDGSTIIVKSNHDEVLQRYLVEGRYVKDDNNHYYALDLAKKYLEDKDPLQYASETIEGLKNKDKIIWLQREEEYKVANVELGSHGDGWGVSMASLEKALGNAVVGHTHTAGIWRGVFRVGTSTKLQQSYNIGGLSTWTHTHCLVYPNGQRQLINIINGEWRLEKESFKLKKKAT